MIERRIRDLGHVLPEPAMPGFKYIPVTIHRRVAYVAGQVPKVGDEIRPVGRVGAEVGFDQACGAARTCVLQGLAWLRHYLGSLDRVERILRLTGYLAVAPGFERMSEVTDAASDLLIDVFGENGRHPRAVVGVLALPRNAPVLLELTVGIAPGPDGGRET